MSKDFSRLRLAGFLALISTWAHGAPADIRDVAAAVLPVPLVAEYACGTSAEGVLRPLFVARWRQKVQASPSPRETLRAALTEYAALMRSFCSDMQTAFNGKDTVVAAIYARQLPGFKGDLPVDERSLAWLKRETAFLQRSVVLLNVYQTAQQLAPDLIDGRTPLRVTSDENQQIQRISVGLQARAERFDLLTLLRDEGFNRVVPKDFDLERWRTEEQQSREEGVRLQYQFSFNANANDLTRQYALSSEYASQMRLALVVERHQPAFTGALPRK